jgi:hypothetical protein
VFSPVLGEASGLVPHCQELLTLLLTFSVDLIFVTSLYALHVGSTRMITFMVQKRRTKKVVKVEANDTTSDGRH